MATTFLLLSSPSAVPEMPSGDNVSGLAASAVDIDPISARPKGRKSGRSASARPAAAPKRPPQRGLGVAQLERIRLRQERWQSMNSSVPDSAPAHSLPAYLPSAVASVGYRGGGSCYFSPTPPALLQPICFLQRGQAPAIQPWLSGYGAGTPASGSSDVRSLLNEQHAMDRFKEVGGADGVGCLDARFRPFAGVPFKELPSNQNSKALICIDPDEYELCVPKRRLYDYDIVYNQTNNGRDYLKVELAGGQGSNGYGYFYPSRGEVKELEFFPGSHSASSSSFSSEFGDRTAGDASSSSSSSAATAAASPHLLDLSLKLSL